MEALGYFSEMLAEAVSIAFQPFWPDPFGLELLQSSGRGQRLDVF